MLYFEDFEVGQEDAFGHYEVTREEVIEFAQKYDPQPFHLSDAAAAETLFGKLSASGWHTCSMTMRMIVEHLAAKKAAGQGAAGIDEIRWKRPVYPGDHLHVQTKVLGTRALDSRPNLGMVRQSTTVLNQDKEVVMTFIGNMLFLRRSE